MKTRHYPAVNLDKVNRAIANRGLFPVLHDIGVTKANYDRWLTLREPKCQRATAAKIKKLRVERTQRPSPLAGIVPANRRPENLVRVHERVKELVALAGSQYKAARASGLTGDTINRHFRGDHLATPRVLEKVNAAIEKLTPAPLPVAKPIVLPSRGALRQEMDRLLDSVARIEALLDEEG